MGVTRGRVIEVGLWVASIVLIGFYCAAVAYGDIERRDAIATFSATHQSPDMGAWSEARIDAHARTEGSEGDPVALLRIASVGLEVPVYMDSTERNLNRGAGLIEGTALPGEAGNVGIAAHRDGYFRALRSVAIGDVLELDSPSQANRYRVVSTFVVDPTAVWTLDPAEVSTVTLVTCYPFYFVGSAPQRYIVRAVLLSD